MENKNVFPTKPIHQNIGNAKTAEKSNYIIVMGCAGELKNYRN
jgi:hypothetical protein